MKYCVSKFLLGAVVAALIADVCAFVAPPHLFGIRAANTHLAMSDEQVSDAVSAVCGCLLFGYWHCPCCPITDSLPCT